MRSDVELVRVIAAFGIVWFHSGYSLGRDFAYGGLIVFIIFSAYFATRSARLHSIGERAARLIVPCILWSALYAVLLTIKGKDIFPDDYSLLSKLLSTPSIHLWYLPFIFFCLVVIDGIKKIFNPTVLAVIAVTLACLLLLSSPFWREWSYAQPFGLYMHAFAAVCVGIVLGLSNRIPQALKYVLIFGICASAVFVFLLGIKGVGVPYLVGIALALLLLRETSLLPKSDRLMEISGTTFGVYLIHPIFLSVLHSVGVSSFALPVLAFIVSVMCVYVSRRIILQPVLKYVM